MDDKKLIEALLGCLDRTDCRKCPIFGQCNGTFESALHVTVEHIKALTAQLTESERQRAAAVDELCLRCGKYHMAHRGACNGCRFYGKERDGHGKD